MKSKAPETLYVRAPKLNQLCILKQLASDSHLTQAELARRCHLSVAMVNNYMKELCHRNLLEYHRKSTKSVTYHVTSEGESMVSVIEHELIDELVGLFAQAKEHLRDLILGKEHGLLRRVVLYGVGHSAELVLYALESAGVSVVAVCDDNAVRIGKEWHGREIVHPAQILHFGPDAVIILNGGRTDEMYHSLSPLLEQGIRLIRLDHAGFQSQVPRIEPWNGSSLSPHSPELRRLK